MFSRRLIPLLLLIGVLPQTPVRAQVIPDQTLGAESSQINRDAKASIDRIEGGAIRGNNLFHSFQEFNINAGERVYFTNPDSITNIFSRVIGSNPSQINGTLGVLGNANLFFLNPNGIQFSSEANLDIRGAFVASTGNSFLFPNGAKFGTINPQNAPILSVNVTAPVGIEFTGDSGGSILLERSDLTLDSQQSLSLIGGEINQKGGSLIVPSGNITLISVVGESIVKASENFAFQIKEGSNRKDITLSENALISIFGKKGGEINIETGNLILSENSLLEGGIEEGSTNTEVVGGKIFVESVGEIRLDESNITNNVEAGGVSKGGKIQLQSARLTLNNGGLIEALVFGESQGSEIEIKATDQVELSGQNSFNLPSSISSQIEADGKGDGGKLTIETGVLSIQDGGFITHSLLGEGKMDEIKIFASERVELLGNNSDGFGSQIRSNIQSDGLGEIGDIEIKTGFLSIQNGGLIDNSIFGEGNTGGITIIAAERVELLGKDRDGFGSLIRSKIESGAQGEINDIEIKTGVLSLKDRGRIGSATFGKGDAEEIRIIATERVELFGQDRSQVLSGVFSEAIGNSGKVDIQTGVLSIRDGGLIASSTAGKGDAGDVRVTATERVELIGQNEKEIDGFFFRSALASEVLSTATGDGGSVTVETPVLLIQDGGGITSTTFGNGDAGEIKVFSEERVELSGVGKKDGTPSEMISEVFPVSEAKGNGGSINIKTGLLEIKDQAGISTRTEAEGSAGEINIVTTEAVTLRNNARLETLAETNFDAGNLTVKTGRFLLDSSLVSASTSGTGKGGDIAIYASESVEVIGEGFQSLQEKVIRPAFQETLTIDNFELGIVTISEGAGNAGEINIETSNFTVDNGGLLATTTLNRGEGGHITIEAQKLITLDDSLLATGTFNQDTANAPSGSVTLISDQLIARGGAQALTSTFGASDAGDVIVRVSDSIELFDPTNQGRLLATGLFAATSQESSGDGGDIDIITGEMTVREEATVTVSAQGTGKAGNIRIEAKNLTLDEGSINASSFNADGGNITLNIHDTLSLRNESAISATAGLATAAGNGGNLLIDTSFVLAEDNSDITANAFAGDGGNITLIAEGIFGLEAREEITAFSDITASSELGEQGVINIETPETDPTSSLTNLPKKEIEVTFQAGCEGGNSGTLALSNVGRGGVALNPNSLLSSNFVLSEWSSLDGNEVISSEASFPVENQSFSFVSLCTQSNPIKPTI